MTDRDLERIDKLLRFLRPDMRKFESVLYDMDGNLEGIYFEDLVNLIAEVRRLREENARSLDAWLRHEGIQPDGEMRATVSSVLAENERLREEIDEWHRISERWGRASGKQYGKLAAIRDLANARLADTAHMASIQEAETLWAIVAATEGE